MSGWDIGVAPPKRLDEALTHPSFAHENPGVAHFERLEFLGDAVLQLVATTHLFATFPEAREGELTRRRHTLVNEAALATWARSLGLEAHLRVGKGQRVTDAMLADAIEAVVGAVFEDSGLEGAAVFLRSLVETAGDASPDPRTELQEWTQAKWKERPVYTEIESRPDDPWFVSSVTLRDGVTATGEGRSTKEARRKAALAALGIVRARGG